tara:strand:+ start:47 stop:565 length:519 start_codon:yes stop_codon:yes gene_type:complete
MAFETDIEDFHEKFDLEYRDYPRPLDPDEKNFRAVCLREEVNEYVSAENLEDELDALVDLVYFALGTCYRHGFDFSAAWERVHAANMAKERAETKSDSKRDFDLDVVKPAGWVAPDLTNIVYPPPNPAMVSIAGGVYAKKRKNLTEAKTNDIIKGAIVKKGSQRENIEIAEG